VILCRGSSPNGWESLQREIQELANKAGRSITFQWANDGTWETVNPVGTIESAMMPLETQCQLCEATENTVPESVKHGFYAVRLAIEERLIGGNATVRLMDLAVQYGSDLGCTPEDIQMAVTELHELTRPEHWEKE
jgi:hypothetical protein